MGDVAYAVRETTAKEVLGDVTRPRSALVSYYHSQTPSAEGWWWSHKEHNAVAAFNKAMGQMA